MTHHISQSTKAQLGSDAGGGVGGASGGGGGSKAVKIVVGDVDIGKRKHKNGGGGSVVTDL